MTKTPLTPYQETLGMIYFARMLDKIRLHAAGELGEEFQGNLGTAFDGRCVDFLRVSYAALTEQVLQGGGDEELLRWCFATGRELNDGDIFVWNEFLKKVGWQDEMSATVERRKRESGFEGCDAIQTCLDYLEYDEGRKTVEE